LGAHDPESGIVALKVIQWATGNVGKKALAAVLDRTDLELVGLYTVSQSKVGVDAGELVGRPAVGVRATNDLESLLQSDADCVLHMPLPSAMIAADPAIDEANIRRCLEAGKNVITTVGYVYPKAYGADVVERLEAACAKGKSSLHGTGLNPGLQGELLPLVLAGLCHDVQCVTVSEATIFATYASKPIIFGLMGLGSTPEAFAGRIQLYRKWLNGLFSESVLMVADGLGLQVDIITDSLETEVAHERFEIAAGVIEPGTIAAQRWRWAARVNGEDRVVHQTTWRAHADAAPNWDKGENSVRIEAAPPIHVALPHGWVGDGLAATAYHAVNAIPAVCAAAPGLRSFLDLPLFTGWAKSPAR
jgi:2,4-diaminopentanoate dehydrogenase